MTYKKLNQQILIKHALNGKNGQNKGMDRLSELVTKVQCKSLLYFMFAVLVSVRSGSRRAILYRLLSFGGTLGWLSIVHLLLRGSKSIGITIGGMSMGFVHCTVESVVRGFTAYP